MRSHRLYRDLSLLYDLLYHSKEYRKEAVRLRKLIGKHKRSPGFDLLEVACGTGNFLVELVDHFRCTGVDLNPDMLKLARKKLPSAPLIQADMTTMDLHKQFDVLLCLFSSIGYVGTEQKLHRTCDTFFRHLKPGGVLVIEPFTPPETYGVGTPYLSTYSDNNIAVARIFVSEKKDDTAVLDFHYLIAERGKGVRHERDRHEMALFSPKAIMAALRNSGFRAKYLKRGLKTNREVFVAIKP